MFIPDKTRSAVRRQNLVRLFLATAFVPMVPALIVILVSVLVGSFSVQLSAWFILLSSHFTYPIALFLGLPLYLLTQWLQWNSVGIYLASGAVLGIVGYLWFTLGNQPLEWDFHRVLYLSQLVLLAISGVLGTFSSFVFWLILGLGGERKSV